MSFLSGLTVSYPKLGRSFFPSGDEGEERFGNYLDSYEENTEEEIKLLVPNGFSYLTRDLRACKYEEVLNKIKIINALMQEIQEDCDIYALQVSLGSERGYTGVETFGSTEDYAGEWSKCWLSSSYC